MLLGVGGAEQLRTGWGHEGGRAFACGKGFSEAHLSGVLVQTPDPPQDCPSLQAKQNLFHVVARCLCVHMSACVCPHVHVCTRVQICTVAMVGIRQRPRKGLCVSG